MKSHLRFSHSTSVQFGVPLKKKTTRIPFLPKIASKGMLYGRRIPNRG
jgi:hypothetical protein